MENRKFVVILFLLLSISTVQSTFLSSIANKFVTKNGDLCLECTLVITVVEQLAEVNAESVDDALARLCSYLPSEVTPICTSLIETYGARIIQLLEEGATSDVVCQDINFCTNPQCHLFPLPPKQFTPSKVDYTTIFLKNLKQKNVEWNPWDWIQEAVNYVFKYHIPFFDMDGDHFSDVDELRGANWRGRDCDDDDINIRPGRSVPPTSLPNVDYNCNGISGVDPKSGQTYKELFCDSVGQMGVAILGGSACSHFEIDPYWLTAAKINESTYDDLIPSILNELDYPQRSWSTGYQLTGDANKPVDSVYLRMRARNLCNHRDYQNIGVNGASSNNIVDNVKTLVRNQTTDSPMLVIYNPLGDDICNMDESDPEGKMTTVPVFYENVMSALNYLDTILPKGSHVLFIGIVDGRILWDNLNNRTHPLGVTYADLYEWLYCIQANPCVGWLTPNETLRNFASERAANLSDQYALIAKNSTFNNFDMAYYPFPLQQIITNYEKSGGNVANLIEPVDGFHPSQVMNALLGDYIYNLLLQDHPTFLGPENPNNAAIAAKFGDQGGY